MKENETKEYKELIKILSSYMSEENIEIVNEYYKEAIKIFDKMKRLTGEDYINHPIRVAVILAKLKMNSLTIGCALIHEAIYLEKMTYQDIEEKFGEEQAIIINSITKLIQLKRNFHQNDTEKYRRIVVGLSENPISLFIKLADRLDNLKTIEVHKKEHIEKIIEETENIYIPIAHRLGIKTMKSELEDLCLKKANPELYQEVVDKINTDKEDLEKSLYKMRDELMELLDEHNIKFEILYRVKSVRGIYNKLKAGKKWENIYDLLGLRLLVEQIEECYLAIGLIHSKYRPIPKRFKDYIANPKNNMYQSLHTTIFGVDEKIFEVQIRTYEMNEIAEHGVASHWSYKEKTDGSKTSVLENKLAAFRTLIEINDKENNDEFFSNINENLTNEDLYIFTPKGDIIELPKGSTPIDFAYKIHTEIGNTCIGAIINGQMVSLDYKLQDGDIVDLKTQKGKAPNKAWLEFVKTDGAKNRIKSYFNKKEKDNLIETGKAILINEIRKKKLSEKELLSPLIIEELLKETKTELEEIYMGIYTLKYTPNIIINKLLEIKNPKKDDTLDKLLLNNISSKNKGNGKFLVGGYQDILTTIASCCNPIPGDEIIGYITKGNGVTIHRKSCKNIDLKNDRIINVSWNEFTLDKYSTTLTIHIDSSNDNLIKILSIATKSDVNILSINNKGKIKEEEIYELICKVKNIEILNKFITELESLNFVSEISR